MKKKGDVEYGEEAEKMILELINNQPKTIGEITRETQKTFGLKIHYYTIKRILHELEKQGLIIIRDTGRFKICERN